MRYIKQMCLTPGMSVGQLVSEMAECGVLGAGSLARGVNIMVEIFEKPEYTTFLSLAGPMVPGGLRAIISHLIEYGFVDAIVTSGANIVHDIIEALGYKGVKGSTSASNTELRKNALGRVNDIYFVQEGFEALEKKAYKVFNTLKFKETGEIAIHELLYAIGQALEDNESFLQKAARRNVPIFSPGIMDSMLGFHIWTYNQIQKLPLNPILDLNKMGDIIYRAKKVGAIILGGGIPKHHVLGVNILREGLDSAVQITLDRPEGGSLSGAPLEEAISWKKAQIKSTLATVIGDASIIFPLMVAASLERIEKLRNHY